MEGLQQELALFQLNQLAKNAELERMIKLSAPFDLITDLQNRVRILEEARQRQIQVNTDLLASIKAGQPTKESWLKKLIK